MDEVADLELGLVEPTSSPEAEPGATEAAQTAARAQTRALTPKQLVEADPCKTEEATTKKMNGAPSRCAFAVAN